jgi:hypothetical protein
MIRKIVRIDEYINCGERFYVPIGSCGHNMNRISLRDVMLLKPGQWPPKTFDCKLCKPIEMTPLEAYRIACFGLEIDNEFQQD